MSTIDDTREGLLKHIAWLEKDGIAKAKKLADLERRLQDKENEIAAMVEYYRSQKSNDTN